MIADMIIDMKRERVSVGLLLSTPSLKLMHFLTSNNPFSIPSKNDQSLKRSERNLLPTSPKYSDID
jgi:hypothetical protein